MAPPEDILVRRRLQIVPSDEDQMKLAMESLEKENLSLKRLVTSLSAMVVRNVTDKK
jgi:hypothetical protein